jgi:hypothetical protein
LSGSTWSETKCKPRINFGLRASSPVTTDEINMTLEMETKRGAPKPL